MKLLKVENQAAYETIATMHHFSAVVKVEYFSAGSATSSALSFTGLMVLARPKALRLNTRRGLRGSFKV